jgi:hypothetical protein
MDGLLRPREITIERLDDSAGQNAVGEVVITYTISARASDGVPYRIDGRPTVMTSQQKIAFGVAATSVGWIIRSETNPKVDGRDQMTWTDADAVEHTARVLQKSHRKGEASKVWRTVTIEDGTSV